MHFSEFFEAKYIQIRCVTQEENLYNYKEVYFRRHTLLHPFFPLDGFNVEMLLEQEPPWWIMG